MPRTIAQGELKVYGVFEFSLKCEETAVRRDEKNHAHGLISTGQKWYNNDMKIKKPASAGGATIAARFQLEPVDTAAAKGGTVGKKSATCALVFGLIALVVSGVLTFVLYKHWEFLMPA